MATRGFIGFENKDESIIGIYNHYDSYPQSPGLGDKLIRFANTPEAAFDLVEQGDIRFWDEEDGSVRFDDGSEPLEYESELRFLNAARRAGAEYVYIYRHYNTWEFKHISADHFVDLEKYLAG